MPTVGLYKRGKSWYVRYNKNGKDERIKVSNHKNTAERIRAELQIRFDKDKFGVESIAYQAALVHLLREEMFRKGYYFEVTPITHGRQRKEERVEGILQPRYASGYITHQRQFGILETSLLDWPNGKKDPPDAEAMAISLLDDYAPMAAPSDSDLGDDEYEPLEEWRAY